MIQSTLHSFRMRVKRRARVKGLLAITLAAALPFAQAQEDPAGLSVLLTPILLIGRPFYELHAIFSGEAANRSANNELREQRRLLSLASRPPVPVHGLYVGRVPMQRVLKDALGFLAVPSVEMDSPSADWLLSEFANQDELKRTAAQHPYVRVSIAEREDRRCAQWAGKDWTQLFPFPGRRCLAVEFVDELASDVELRLDASRVNDRHLEWQIRDRSSQAVKFSSPFWSAYPERKGSGENTIEFSYDAWDYSNALALAIQQLSPAAAARDSHGIPLTLRWTKAHQQAGHPEHYRSIPAVLGTVQPHPDYVRDSKLTWAEQVDQSYASGTGRMVFDRYAILPTRDLVMAPSQPYASTVFVLGTGVYSAQISNQRIFIMKFGDDALPAWGLALDLDKAPELGLCTEQEKVRCHTLLHVASMSTDAVILDIHVLGWRGDRISYPVTVPVAWLTN